ncbi:palmitoyl-protein thioesterase [Coprinopsis marcescibilis]|uniref:Palmitoyl-protein thioesterase 1 n=1 Tax=Coprinopsis marcescibilis TaxID=230819 RepID=A0A5C3KY74_COPMA|nr:palmitoyl-protein thioesterase [Coprinopsis marcescibilis]
MFPLTIIICTVIFYLQCIVLASDTHKRGPRPLVLWHGLGDSHSSPGMVEFAGLIKEVHPGIFIHSVYIDQEEDKDRRAGFYGNVNDQVALVAGQLASIMELEGGFDAIGFSQGGQFLRAYVERYNEPKVNNLITFGSQHMGISDIPICGRYDLLCQIARRAARGSVYGEWAQNNLVTAQYFRNPDNYATYLEANKFLTSINNEKEGERNGTYAKNLASLNKIVLVLFTEDKTVVPKESSWFGSEAIPGDDEVGMQQRIGQRPFLLNIQRRDDREIIPMRLQRLYTEDWIGLRTLDTRGDVILETCEGEHMQVGDCWKPLVLKFVGGKA